LSDDDWLDAAYVSRCVQQLISERDMAVVGGVPQYYRKGQRVYAGKVFDFLYLGDVTVYVVELPNGSRVEAMLPNSAPGRAKFFEAGDPVQISWRVDAGRFLTD
jgi:hypothetical protein